MKISNRISRAATVVLPLVLFLIVSFTGFFPQIEGRVLNQHDTRQFDAMSRDIRQCRKECDRDPQWTGAMFGGMPAYMINIKYDSQIIKRITDTVTSAVHSPAGMIFFAMVGAWLMMVMFGCPAWLGVLVGLMYGLSTYFFLIIGAGHITKMWALVFAPLFLGSVYMTLRGNMLKGGVLASLFATMEISANHPQITYYFLLTVIILWVNDLIFAAKDRRLSDFAKRTGILALAAVLAIGANFAPLYYTAEHSSDTIRGGSQNSVEGIGSGLDLEYATAWSYGKGETWNLLIPDFMGGDSAKGFSADGPVARSMKDIGLSSLAPQLPAYWGEQPYTAGPTYLGAVAIFLALIGISLASRRNRWWMLVSLAVSVVLAWGHNAMWATEFCFRYLPGYNKFRTVSTILVVAELIIPLSAGIGLWKLVENIKNRMAMRRAILFSAAVLSVILLFFTILGGNMFDFNREVDGEMMSKEFKAMLSESEGGDEYIRKGVHDELGWAVADAMAEERGHILEKDAARSLGFILLAAAVLLLMVSSKIKRPYALSALAIIIVLDMLPVNLRYLPYDRYVPERKTAITPTEADKKIMQDTEPGYRVLNLTVSPFNDATTSMFHRSVGGYHGAKLGRYQDVITAYLNRCDERILDLLNTKYVITSDKDFITRETYGAAWTVDSIAYANNAQEELALLGETDLRHTAVLNGNDRVNPVLCDGDAEIELTSYQPDRLQYRYVSDKDCFVVFSEIFYDKGWKAYIDGRESQYCCADYILRGISVPAGSHTIEWKFRAPNWTAVSAATLVCSIIIILLLVLYFTPAMLKVFRTKGTDAVA